MPNTLTLILSFRLILGIPRQISKQLSLIFMALDRAPHEVFNN